MKKIIVAFSIVSLLGACTIYNHSTVGCEAARKARPEHHKMMKKDFNEIFIKIDTNKDGVISKKEWKKHTQEMTKKRDERRDKRENRKDKREERREGKK